MSTKSHLLIYGASGYSGELIARAAVERGLRPILGGRSEEKLRELHRDISCDFRVFSLDDPATIASQLADVSCVLNCAGPFSRTAVPMWEACLRAGVNYLDITGEIDVIEAAAALDGRAKACGVAVIPAVGFDVVPSDCLAAQVCRRLPDATHLQLAFSGPGGLSPGTLKTALEGLPQGGRARIDGEIRRVPLAWKSLDVPFCEGVKRAITIPWGDVASAYYSTGVRDIEVFTTVAAENVKWLKRLGWMLPLLRCGWLQNVLKRRIESNVRGPTGGDRAASRSSLWCRASNARGVSLEGTLTGPSAYDLTVLTSLAAVERIQHGGVPPGFHTPSKAFGADFINAIPGVEVRINELR